MTSISSSGRPGRQQNASTHCIVGPETISMHRLEPALDAADQRVVVEALIVRLMRLERDLVFARARRQRRVSAAAIAMAIRQIRVELKIVQLSAKRTQSDNAPQPSSGGRMRSASTNANPSRSTRSRSAIVMLASEAVVAEGVQGSPACRCAGAHGHKRLRAPADPSKAGQRARISNATPLTRSRHPGLRFAQSGRSISNHVVEPLA